MSSAPIRQSSAVRLTTLGFGLFVAGCASGPPPGPTVMVLPGQGKDLAAFQQDDMICRQHAIAHTGFGGSETPPPAVSGTATAPSASDEATKAATSDTEPADRTAYAQCMASRGDTVRVDPSGYASVNPYGYPFPGPYAYWYGDPYAYDYPFFFYGGGFYHGLGWSRDGVYRGEFHAHGFAGRGFGHGGFGHGGFARGGGGHR